MCEYALEQCLDILNMPEKEPKNIAPFQTKVNGTLF